MGEENGSLNPREADTAPAPAHFDTIAADPVISISPDRFMASTTTPTIPARSQAKLAFFVFFFAVTIFVTYLKNRQIFDANSLIARHFAPMKWYVAIHAVFGVVAMTVAAFQFSNRLRARYLTVHRVLGYVYVVSVFISAPLAGMVAIKSAALPMIAANFTQSFGWIVTTGIALYCVRNGNIAQHRRWMIRSYPFAMVFTVARTLLPIPAIAALGSAGRETVVWSSIAMAMFLPTIFLDWRSIVPRRAVKQVAAR